MCSEYRQDKAGFTPPASPGEEAAAPLAAVAQAIDDLAAQDHGSLTAAELTGRVASIWALVSDIDPELARRTAGYTRSTEDSAASEPPEPSGPDDLDV